MKTKSFYTILREEEDYIVVDKMPGVLTVPGRRGDEPNLKHMLSRDRDRFFWPVHRLDQETSGLVIFAKSEDAHKHLNSLFAQRQIDKKYLALSKGNWYVDEGTINEPIADTGRGTSVIRSDGRSSTTHYKVLERFRSATFLELKPITGRTHQIRVHLAHVGHPLLIDEVYGGEEAFYLSSIKKKKFNLAKDELERPLMHRLTLHCHELAWNDSSGSRVCVQSDLPKDFSAVLNQLRKWSKQA